MKFIEKVQNLPEKKRKIIFWSVIIALGILLLVCWGIITKKRVETFKPKEFKEELKIPSLNIEIPEINQDDLEKLEEMLKNNEGE